MEESQPGRYRQRRSVTRSRTPVVDNFSQDLTKLAVEEKLDYFKFGRDQELNILANYLFRRIPKNILICGAPGTGKMALLNTFAHLIVGTDNDLQRNYLLKNKRLMLLHFNSLFTEVKSYSRLVERYAAMRNELEKAVDVVLCAKNIDQILEDTRFSKDFIRYFLENDTFGTIGTISKDKYDKLIAQDYALKTLFTVLYIKPPQIPDIITSLYTNRGRFEAFHDVNLSEEVVESIVNLAEEHFQDLPQPMKSIDLLDEVCAMVRLDNIEIPKHILDLDIQISELQNEKEQAKDEQAYEKAADIRDKQSKLVRQLEFAKVQWQDESKSKLHDVTKDDVLKMISLKKGDFSSGLKKS